jgi:hypothetical protein
VRVRRQVATPVEGDLVRLTSTFTGAGLDRPETSRSTLRFLDTDSLTSFLSAAGLTIEEQFGDWERSPLTDSSPEIISIARRELTLAGR